MWEAGEGEETGRREVAAQEETYSQTPILPPGAPPPKKRGAPEEAPRFRVDIDTMFNGFPSYIMPPMPWSCPPAAGASGSGMSVIMHSVMSSRELIEPAC